MLCLFPTTAHESRSCFSAVLTSNKHDLKRGKKRKTVEMKPGIFNFKLKSAMTLLECLTRLHNYIFTVAITELSCALWKQVHSRKNCDK